MEIEIKLISILSLLLVCHGESRAMEKIGMMLRCYFVGGVGG